jgi:hypothetical protein
MVKRRNIEHKAWFWIPKLVFDKECVMRLSGFTFVAVAFVLAGGPMRGVGDESKKEKSTADALIGTWKLVSARYGGRDFKFPEGTTMLKHVTPTQFLWVTYDQDGKVFRSAGGYYTLKGTNMRRPLSTAQAATSKDSREKRTPSRQRSKATNGIKMALLAAARPLTRYGSAWRRSPERTTNAGVRDKSVVESGGPWWVQRNREPQLVVANALEVRNMDNSKQSGLSIRPDWRDRIAGAIGVAVVGGLSLLALNLADVHMFPVGLIVYMAAIVVGIFLGRFVGSRLFRKPPDGWFGRW